MGSNIFTAMYPSETNLHHNERKGFHCNVKLDPSYKSRCNNVRFNPTYTLMSNLSEKLNTLRYNMLIATNMVSVIHEYSSFIHMFFFKCCLGNVFSI